MTINFSKIHKSYNGIDIFNNLEGTIYSGEKVGLIGVNGIGKTTLVKILMGIEDHDNVQYSYIRYSPKKQIFSYLKQNNNFSETESVTGIISSFTRELNSQCNSNRYLRTIKTSLMELGFRERDFKKKYKHLSGGEKTRLSLCMALVQNPDVLVLDEPTNNLDMKAIAWLERFIKKIDKTVIIISHDRYFLDNTVERILEMKKDKLTEYGGNYSKYKTQKEIEYTEAFKKRTSQNKELVSLRKSADQKLRWFNIANASDRNRDEFSQRIMKHTSSKQHRAFKAVNSKIRILKENLVEIPKEDFSAIYDLFNKMLEPPKNLKYFVNIKRLKKAFGTKVIFDNAALHIKPGDKVALLGENGSGKTTLIKMLMNLEPRDSGTLIVHPALKVGYYAQELDTLNYENTVQQEIIDCGLSKRESNNLLAAFLFKREALQKKIKYLSMGERGRLTFCKLLAQKCNFLVLDEPTNHMDIVSREAIEKALKRFKGTILFVSHDRYFAKSLANKIVTIENHKLMTYNGDYDYYLKKLCEEKCREKLGDSYNYIHANILRLECELAFVSSQLKRSDDEENSESLSRFFTITSELEKFKSML